MKITDVKTWAVKNPEFYKGGTYWIFVKRTTDDGISGYGEVYGVPFAPRVVRQMIEDVVARHVVGRSPFDIETIWRILYSSDFSMRPDISMGGVMSGIVPSEPGLGFELNEALADANPFTSDDVFPPMAEVPL